MIGRTPIPSGCGKCALYAGLWGLHAHLDDDVVCWNRIVNLNSYLRDEKMMVDQHPQASIYSHRPYGLGRDELNSEIPVIMPQVKLYPSRIFDPELEES